MNPILSVGFACVLLLFVRAYAECITDYYDYPCPKSETCPPPECPPGSDGAGPGASGCNTCDRGGALRYASTGMPVWRVTFPYASLWIDDEPLGYKPARGERVSFKISHKQRQDGVLDTNTFSVGQRWNIPWVTFYNGKVTVAGDGELLNYTFSTRGQEMYSAGSVLTNYALTYPDGRVDNYGFAQLDSLGNPVRFFLSDINIHGNSTLFLYEGYNPTNAVIRLKYVVDGDGRTNTISYPASHPFSTNLITGVTDAYGRSTSLQYDSNGYLTNVTDVAGMSSSFKYDANGWITNMSTPYGNTSFAMTTTHDRMVEVTEADGGHQLFVHIEKEYTNAVPTAFSGSEVPNTTNSNFSFPSRFGNLDLTNHNSFHWDRQQYGKLSANFLATHLLDDLTANDMRVAHWQHWLAESTYVFTHDSQTLSMERFPSPDGGTTEGQKIWYDYPGKEASDNGAGARGTNSLPLFVAKIMPDGTTAFTRYERNGIGKVLAEISTYTMADGTIGVRTNQFTRSADDVDEITHIGPRAEQVSSNAFNGFHQVTTNFNALGEMTVYTYNTDHQLTSIRTPTGLTTTNIYNALGQLQKTIDLEINRTNSFTYVNNLLASSTDPRGMTINYTYDNLQRLTSSSFPDGTTISNRYQSLDLASVKDRLGNWTSFAYNAVRQKIYQTNVLGFVTRYDYCECGALGSIIDPLNHMTSFTYDLNGKRTSVTYPDSTYVTNVYDLPGRLIRVGDSAGNWTTNYFNQQGLLTVSSNAAGQLQRFTYDIEDRPTNIVNGNGVALSQTFDDLGRVRTRTYPDGGVEKFGYSPAGLVNYTNQLNQISRLAYDAGGRKTAETNANSEVVQYKYDPAGGLTNLVDGKSQSTFWKYDQYGRVTNKVDNTLSNVFVYAYDANDRMTNRSTPAKGSTTFKYDGVGNLTNVLYPVSPAIALRYDPANQLTNMTDAAGTTVFGYSSAGFLASEDGPWTSDTISFGYGNRLRTSLSLQLPSGTWTNGYIYDAANRLTNLTANGGSYGYSFTSPGSYSSRLIQKLLLPNSSVITNDFDGNGRLTVTALRNSFGTLLNYHSYAYDAGNRRTQTYRTDSSRVDYAYDNISQLKTGKAYNSLGAPITGEQFGYNYDSAWNLNYRTNNGTTEIFKVNSLNALTNAPGHSCTYDLNGNLITDGTAGFVYDDENQLIRITVTNAWKSEFTYDGQMRRRIRKEFSWSGAWVQTNEIRYVYDGNLVIQERDISNNPKVTYTRGVDLSGSRQEAGGIGGMLARYDNSALSVAYYHADGNGNITSMIDAVQAVVASYKYDPFGFVLSQSGTLSTNNLYRWSSKEVHPNSGLVYYLYRYYEPNFQRWLNRDPLEDEASLVYAINSFDSQEDLGLSSFQVETVEGPNLYGFVANSPLGLWDGFGTSKGGKQNISCEGFTKNSCPEDVAKALEEAKKLKQLKRASALRGLLKVIKRGGGMMFFYMEFFNELINQSCPGGGGSVMAYNETYDNNMTSDGISTEDWKVVLDYAAKIANAACADDEATSDEFTKELLRYLECLEAKYGKLSSILATRADYAADLSQRVRLLEEAYELARKSGDRANLTFTASSLAQLFVEEAVNVSSAREWLALLADALGDKWDDLEHQQLQKLTAQIESLKQQGKPGSLA